MYTILWSLGRGEAVFQRFQAFDAQSGNLVHMSQRYQGRDLKMVENLWRGRNAMSPVVATTACVAQALKNPCGKSTQHPPTSTDELVDKYQNNMDYFFFSPKAVARYWSALKLSRTRKSGSISGFLWQVVQHLPCFPLTNLLTENFEKVL